MKYSVTVPIKQDKIFVVEASSEEEAIRVAIRRLFKEEYTRLCAPIKVDRLTPQE